MKKPSNKSIGFDARPLFRERDGISTYTEQTILAAAKKYPSVVFSGIIFKEDAKNKCLIEILPENIKIVELPFSWKRYRALTELGIWKPIDKYAPYQMFGFVYFNFTTLPWVSNKIQKNLVIHDATYVEYPETVNKKNLKYLQKFVKLSVNKPGVNLFTISRFSADILKDYFGKEFNVAYPGQSPLQVVKMKKANKKKAFLFVGTLEPRKNLNNLIHAYNSLSADDQKNHNLVIAGRDGWYHKKLVDEINANKNIVRIVNPSDKQLSQIYQNVSFFVMPSIFEGFGIPVIDATRFELPVITSDKSPMQEVLGKDGAIYIDPADIRSIKNGMKKIISLNDKTLERMVFIASKNIQKFSWDITAEKLFSEFID